MPVVLGLQQVISLLQSQTWFSYVVVWKSSLVLTAATNKDIYYYYILLYIIYYYIIMMMVIREIIWINCIPVSHDGSKSIFDMKNWLWRKYVCHFSWISFLWLSRFFSCNLGIFQKSSEEKQLTQCCVCPRDGYYFISHISVMVPTTIYLMD